MMKPRMNLHNLLPSSPLHGLSVARYAASSPRKKHVLMLGLLRYHEVGQIAVITLTFHSLCFLSRGVLESMGVDV